MNKKILEDIKVHKYYISQQKGYNIGIFQSIQEFFEQYPHIIEDKLKGVEIDALLVGFIIEDKINSEKNIILRRKDKEYFENNLQYGCIKKVCPSLTNGEVMEWINKYAKLFRDKLGELELPFSNCIIIKDVNLEERLYNSST